MTIRSHFVPQFYLKNFGDKLYFYDKTDQSIKESTPANLALKKDFYGPTDEKKTNPVETALSGLEGSANTAISKVIATKNFSNLSGEEKANLCSFVAIQYLRTQESRMRITEVTEKIVNEVAKQKGVTDWEVKVTKEGETGMHLNIMKDFGPIAAVLGSMGAIIFTNDTDIPLWTSDNPVVLNNDLEQFPWGNLGITSKGIEIHLPLTPKLGISFYDPVTFQGMPEKAPMEKDNVIRENFLQTICSTRFMYSNTDEFHLSNDYLNSNPDAKKVDKQRVSPGIHEMKPEDFEGKKMHDKPEFWMDPKEFEKMRKQLEGKND